MFISGNFNKNAEYKTNCFKNMNQPVSTSATFRYLRNSAEVLS
jgi:hypothetical protein